ncbi:hypothetical protein IGI04_037225 [Brassica rapa subsp. trilocularis]|uniref:Uncharacterized protein n=1 Tax=Brassica rapa subsp. trilocularis TaxID=1813537 RepID=A0ABQ7LGQ4_BRACM|nr:hypothetical protein IGI04_037225 [Brassica rapa subsp. trilocularis]
MNKAIYFVPFFIFPWIKIFMNSLRSRLKRLSCIIHFCPPNGINFKPPRGNPTGRFTNGRTIADIRKARAAKLCSSISSTNANGEALVKWWQLRIWWWRNSQSCWKCIC